MDEKKYSEDNVRYNKLILHFRYAIIILFVVIIGIITFHCFDDRDTFNAVSFCSAIISIILAVLTIVYSYYLNSNSSGQVETLNNAAKEVSNATKSYSDSAITLHANIGRIIEAVNRIEVKTDRIINESLGNNSTGTNDIKFDAVKYIQNYVELSSPLGIMAMYICIQSKDYNKSFPLTALNDEKISIYIIGFLISTFVTGILSGNIDFENDIIHGTEYSGIAKQTLEEWINKNKNNTAVTELKPIIDNHFNE